jgi:hypothetical protein
MQVAAGASAGVACKMQCKNSITSRCAGVHNCLPSVRPVVRHFGVALRQLPLSEPLRAVRADQATEAVDAAVVQVGDVRELHAATCTAALAAAATAYVLLQQDPSTLNFLSCSLCK